MARAQGQYVPKDETLKGAGAEDVDGWNPSLAGTATVNLVSNQNVVGQVDGFSTLFGLGVVAGADYVKGRHLMRNTLSISESFARTPVVEEFVKTNDVVQVEGLYNYFLNKKVGLYGRVAIQTSAFAATDVRGVETTWVDKGTRDVLTTGFRQRLADPLSPFTLSESTGLFAEPYAKEKFALSLRFGAGGRHTLADGVLLIDDDKATPEVELLRLANVHQLGLEAFAGVGGKLEKGKVLYKAGLAVLAPFVNNDKFDRKVVTLTRVGFEGTLTFNMFEWMSLVYSVKIIKDAQLFPEGQELTQVQNNVLLTFKYAFVEKKKKKKEPTEAEKALAEAKDRAEKAEKAKLEADTKIQDLEKQLSTCKTTACVPAATPDPAPAPAPNP
ncbi:MAG: hypothetical protein KF773_31950 [Deltaproteobacteria bacterium]|nr:hypothetical protein [Deltaproteobacteria bacterium]